jgi:hypothetical protein
MTTFNDVSSQHGEVHELLGGLGDTPERVAQSLLNKGIKGLRRKGTNCPIANYLKEQGIEFFGVNWDYVVIQRYGRWWAAGGYGWTETIADIVSNPAPVLDFIRAFDGGEYPELEAKD